MLNSEETITLSNEIFLHETFTGKFVHQKRNIYELLNTEFPGLIKSVESVIQKSEFNYSNGTLNESFLWQHTVYVASMAMTISYAENVDPLIPVVTALFHDCGKFENGKYHDGEKPEEEIGAEIAVTLLKKAGFPQGHIQTVRDSLLALYNENKAENSNTKIVHDSDFLIKFGHMGFANFFEKSVLRGMVVQNSILKSMSKELTYAASLEGNMFTAWGRKLARTKAKTTIRLFKNYLQELRDAGIGDYEIREMEVNCCKGPNAIIPLLIVLPRFCDICSQVHTIDFQREKGIKCEQLIVKIQCPRCGEKSSYDFSFCLPELAGH
jgi:HD superfamily phosphodiesterase